MKYVSRAIVCICMLLVLTSVAAAHNPLHTVIRVGVRPGSPPLCFFENDENRTNLRGLNIDIMEQVSKLTKLRIIYVDTQNLVSRWDMLKNNEIEVIMIAGAGDSDPLFKYLSLGVSLKRRIYVHHSCKTVVCDKDLADKKVGVLAGDSWNRYPTMGQIVQVMSELEGLKRLDDGDFDAFIAPSELVAGYLIQKHQLRNVLQVGMVLDTKPLHLAVKAENSVLAAQLSEAIAQMERRGIMQTIQEKWYGVAFPPDSWEKYGQMALIGIGVAALSLFTVLFWNHHLKSQIRKVKRNLQVSESKSRALIEFSPDIIFVLNPEGDIINANKEARTLILGDRFDPRNMAKLIHYAAEEDILKVRAFTALVFKQGQGSADFSFHDINENIRELSIAAILLAGEHAETGPVACFFARDVTERNRIERELVHADRMSIMGQMAASVAHEINNPLGIVRANLELIASRGWFDKEAEEFVDAIRRNTERAGKITKNLLEVTKPSHAVMTDVDLEELLEKTLSMVRPQLKGIAVESRNIEASVVNGDRNLLQQVLVNVLLNAQNAMNGQSKPLIEVTCCSNPEKTTARIKVADNGNGIEKKLLTKIFEPFFTYSKKEGFGLGLYISQRIIERHHGMIFAESDTGKGTQIVIELPLIEANQDRI